jgi:hypothetical protein
MRMLIFVVTCANYMVRSKMVFANRTDVMESLPKAMVKIIPKKTKEVRKRVFWIQYKARKGP